MDFALPIVHPLEFGFADAHIHVSTDVMGPGYALGFSVLLARVGEQQLRIFL